MTQIKILFDLIKEIGTCLIDNIHILSDSEYDEKIRYIIYHSNGHCIVVEREKVDVAEDETCENIEGYCYYFTPDLYEGFKEISLGEVMGFIKKIKHNEHK